MPTPLTDPVDVAIIGAGPVGLTLANILGRLGCSVAVLERESEGYALPRAVTFDDEIMRLFQGIGLAEDISAIVEVGSDAQFVDAAGKVLLTWERPRELTPNGWFVNYRFHQPTLETALRRGLEQHKSVRIFWNCEVTGIAPQETGVRLSTGKGHELDATYVVGCDGGRSFTRKWIGGGSHDLGFHEDWLIVDLLNHEVETDPDRKTTHYCGTDRMGSKVFAGRRRKRWELRLKPEDDRDALQDRDVIWDILKEWIGPETARIERTAVYTFHSLIARNWSRGRVFIAGDAAHQTPPFMGQGMCAGLRDAANLGWKLAWALKGRGPQDLLQTYESERKPHVRTFIDLTMEMGRLINSTAQNLDPKAHGVGGEGEETMKLFRPTLGPGLCAGDGTGRGALVAQVTLSDGRRLDDAAGLKPVLASAAPLDHIASAAQASGLGVITDPALATILDPGEVMVIRPDRAILGRAPLMDAQRLFPAAWTTEMPMARC